MRQDVLVYLEYFGYRRIAEHSFQVAEVAAGFARQFGADPAAAMIASWLHDVSVVVPEEERVALAEGLGFHVLFAERRAPLLLHQKLSAVIAREIFGVGDAAILSAIGCHTTLRAGASLLDLVVFLADKMAWDQAGRPEYADQAEEALNRSLDEAVFVYLDYLWQRRDALAAIHPWLEEAYTERRNGR